jgi:hypothetical protein
VIDNRLCQRAGFQKGKPIRLADGQEWIFPDPEGAQGPFRSTEHDQYLGLIEALLDAEDIWDRRRSELAFAIHLISQNYHLGAAELQLLFTFLENSPELAEAQAAFADLASEHIRASIGSGAASDVASSPPPRLHGRLARFVARVRGSQVFGIGRWIFKV